MTATATPLDAVRSGYSAFARGDSRMTASSVVAFIFSIPRRSLVLTGRGSGDAPR